MLSIEIDIEDALFFEASWQYQRCIRCGRSPRAPERRRDVLRDGQRCEELSSATPPSGSRRQDAGRLGSACSSPALASPSPSNPGPPSLQSGTSSSRERAGHLNSHLRLGQRLRGATERPPSGFAPVRSWQTRIGHGSRTLASALAIRSSSSACWQHPSHVLRFRDAERSTFAASAVNFDARHQRAQARPNDDRDAIR